MKCPNCGAEIEEGSVYCPDCGFSQEASKGEPREVHNHMFCPGCGMELEEGTLFCPGCGRRMDMEGPAGPKRQEKQDASYEPYRKKGGSVPMILIFILLALLIVGGVGFAVYSFFGKTKETVEPQIVLEEKARETLDDGAGVLEDEDDVDLSEVDINAVEDENCTLEGKIKKADNGVRVLSWPESIVIYGIDELGKPVLAEDVTAVYLDENQLGDGILDSVAANEEVRVSGSIYIRGNTVYLEAKKVTDAGGREISAEEEMPEAALSGEYIIPYSDTAILTYSDISGLSLQEINYAKNEIYARKGRRFQSAELQNYFNSKSWYRGTVAPEDFSDSMLSDIEKRNAEFLSEVEFGMAPNGYQLDQ